MNEPRAYQVVVLGAGITGLTAAYELSRRARRENRKIEITVLEGSLRIGGKVLTESRDGLVIEGGPDSFITLKPEALDLIEELGLSGELIATGGAGRVWVHAAGRLRELPDGTGLVPRQILPFLFSDILSWRGKARLALEPFIPALDGDEDESLAAFARRRMGREALDRLAGPLLAGIYAGDPEQLSVASSFPQLKEMERRGGLLRAAWRAKPAADSKNRSLFMSLKGGLSTLTEALARRLPPQTVRTGVAVEALRRRGAQWEIKTASGVVLADAVIATLPANALAGALLGADPELAAALGEIPFVSTATVSLAYAAQDFPASAFRGFGFLTAKEGRGAIVGATYTSSKWPGRAPRNVHLVRCFLGGAGAEAAAEGDENEAIAQAEGELRGLLKLGSRRPKSARFFRWPKGNPQYTVGHALRLKRIESRLQSHPGLALAGCSYKGVGLPDCIRSGREAACLILSMKMS